jgi:hypothetical protein
MPTTEQIRDAFTALGCAVIAALILAVVLLRGQIA